MRDTFILQAKLVLKDRCVESIVPIKLFVHGTISQLLTNIAFKTAKNTIFNDKNAKRIIIYQKIAYCFFNKYQKYLPSAFGAGICL